MTEPADFSEATEAPNASDAVRLPLPPDLGWDYVRTPGALAAAAEALSQATVIGVDTESDSFFSYRERCCLVQITAEGLPDFIIDPLAVPDLSPLGPLFADPRITKVFHGADYDVVILKRDFGFTFETLFDTMIAAQATGRARFGLSDLVAAHFGMVLDKKWQRHDWSSRPLHTEHLEYARYDSHFLPALMRLLQADAQAAGRTAMLEEECRLLEARAWTGRAFDPDDCIKIKGAQSLDPTALKVLRAVNAVRERLAEAKGRPPFKVWGNDECLQIARTAPTQRADLARALGPQNHVLRRYADEVLTAVAQGLADESPPPGRKKPPPRSPDDPPPFQREDEPLFERLKSWRNRQADAERLGPGMVLPNHLLRVIAAVKPVDEAALRAVPDVRSWQVHNYGEPVLEILRRWVEEHPPAPAKAEETKSRSRRRRRRRRSGGEGESGGAGNADGPSEAGA